MLAAGATWFITRSAAPASASGKQPLYYQSAMHPWIKSDKPGKCTICGMALTPIYPGDKPMEASANDNIVALSDQQIHVLGVRTAEATIQPLTRRLAVAGVIDDDATRHRVISAYVDGRIEKLHVNFMGAEVTAGQPLADFYSPSLLQAEREFRQLDGELRRNTALRLRQMGLTPDQIEFLQTTPAWFTAAWAIGVWLSIAGSVLLLLRSRHAAAAFALSLAGLAASAVYSFGLAETTTFEIMGGFAALFSAAIAALLLAQYFYARAMTRRGACSKWNWPAPRCYDRWASIACATGARRRGWRR